MSETEINGHVYRIGTMSAKKQWNVARRLMPVLAEIVKAGRDLPQPPNGDSAPAENAEAFLDKISEPLANAFSSIKDEDSDYVIDQCLAVCDRQQGTGGVTIWAPLMRGGTLMFSDLDMTTMLSLTFATIRENLGNFFSSDQPNSSAAAAPPK
jgi:hypothetical protein